MLITFYAPCVSFHCKKLVDMFCVWDAIAPSCYITSALAILKMAALCMPQEGKPQRAEDVSAGWSCCLWILTWARSWSVRFKRRRAQLCFIWGLRQFRLWLCLFALKVREAVLQRGAVQIRDSLFVSDFPPTIDRVLTKSTITKHS